MRKVIIAELLQDYAASKASAEAEADRKRSIIAQKAPLYNGLGARLARAMAECASNGGNPEDAVKKIRAEAEAQLEAAGYSLSDLVPQYSCQLCSDTGYVGMPVKSFCECFEKRLNEAIVERSGLSSVPGHNFCAFNIDVFPDEGDGLTQREMMRRLHKFASEWSEGFPEVTKKDILLSGKSGVGKTFLADCISARVLERGYSVLRMTAFRMIEALRAHHIGQDPDNALQAVFGTDLLFIDDLGTEPVLKNITVEYLFSVLNERQHTGKSTIVATNLHLPELRERYTERVTSRLANAEKVAVFRIDGIDIRSRRDAK